MKKIYSLSILLLFAFVSNSQTSVTFKICGGNGTDAYLASGQPTSNFGNHPNFGGNTWTCTGPVCNARGLMTFNLSSIPTTATITAANLLLFADGGWGPSPTLGPGNDGSILNVTSAWTESLVTWNTQPATSITNSVYIPASSSSVQNYTLNLTSMVQNWVTNPSSNNGFLLKMNDEINFYKSLIFASSDNSDTTKCPRLQVTYITSGSPTYTTNVGGCGNSGVDAYLASGQASSNFGNHPQFGGNTWTCSGLCNARGLMNFNLSTIPTNAVVISANLYLFADTGWGIYPTWGPGNDGSILKVAQPWTESTVTWNTQPATVATNSVYIPGSGSVVAQNYTLNITSLVQDWVSNPSTNYGYLLKMNDEINFYKSLIFASSDNTNPNFCTYANIVYTIPTATPEFVNNALNFVRVYPNPGNGNYILKGAEGLEYSVMDNSGKLIKKGIVAENNETLSLSEFNDGIYFIIFKSENNVVSQKLVKIND